MEKTAQYLYKNFAALARESIATFKDNPEVTLYRRIMGEGRGYEIVLSESEKSNTGRLEVRYLGQTIYVFKKFNFPDDGGEEYRSELWAEKNYTLKDAETILQYLKGMTHD